MVVISSTKQLKTRAKATRAMNRSETSLAVYCAHQAADLAKVIQRFRGRLLFLGIPSAMDNDDEHELQAALATCTNLKTLSFVAALRNIGVAPLKNVIHNLIGECLLDCQPYRVPAGCSHPHTPASKP